MHNRITEREQLKRKLEAGTSIHMPAPRRIGKTWTLNRLATDLRADKWQAIQVDVQGLSTPRDFSRELCKRIESQSSIKDKFLSQMKYRLDSLLGGGNNGDNLQEILAQVDPIEFTETLISSLNEMSDTTAILVDEIAYFFLNCAEKDVNEAYAFAYKLRAMQQRYTNVRWVLTGSIGLQTIAKRYQLEGAFVDFETFVLEPFDPDQARSYMRDENIRQQFNHIFDAEDSSYDKMFTELGWLAPYYLKLVANEVRPSGGIGSDNVPIATESDFTEAFDRLLQPNRKSEFSVWTEHVNKNLPSPDKNIAVSLLHKLSKSPDGEELNTLLAHANTIQKESNLRRVRDILDILLNDGLIQLSENRYAFQSGLIRRYWKEYEAE